MLWLPAHRHMCACAQATITLGCLWYLSTLEPKLFQFVQKQYGKVVSRNRDIGRAILMLYIYLLVNF